VKLRECCLIGYGIDVISAISEPFKEVLMLLGSERFDERKK